MAVFATRRFSINNKNTRAYKLPYKLGAYKLPLNYLAKYSGRLRRSPMVASSALLACLVGGLSAR